MTAKTDPVVGSETWAVMFDGGTTADVRVDRHKGSGERGEWFYAHCAAWPGVPYAIHMSGNTARYAVERIVACGIGNADNDEQGCGVREIVAPDAAKADAVAELYNDLMRRAEACDALAERYDRASVNAARCGGKADAYRHAAELLRAAAKGVVR